MVNCSITGCKSCSDRNQPNITFHRFPHEPVYKTKWIKSTGRVNWQLTKHSRICSRHFETNCFRPSKNGTYMYLKLRSVPTLFIPIQDEEAVSQPSTSKCESLAMNIETRDFSIHHEPAIDQPSTSKCGTWAMNMETRDFSFGDSFMTDDHD